MCCAAAKMRPVLRGKKQPFEVSVDVILPIISHTGEFSTRGHKETQRFAAERRDLYNCCHELKQGMTATVPSALVRHVATGIYAARMKKDTRPDPQINEMKRPMES